MVFKWIYPREVAAMIFPFDDPSECVRSKLYNGSSVYNYNMIYKLFMKVGQCRKTDHIIEER